MNAIHTGIKWAGLGFVVLATLAYGSYPVWAAGPAVAGMCLLGVAHVLVSLLRGSDILDAAPAVRALVFVVAFWLGAMVVYDVVAGVSSGRVPALSVRQIPYAFAFFSALMLGSQFKTSGETRSLLWVLALLGVVLAGFAYAEKFSWDVKTSGPSTAALAARPSGLFINPNRLAVMLSMCLTAALAHVASGVLAEQSHDSRAVRHHVRLYIAILSALIIGGSLVMTLSRLTILSFGFSLCVVTWLWTRASHSRASYQREFSDMPLADRIQRVLFIGLPVIVLAAWVTWTLAFGGHGLNERLRAIDNSEGRLTVLKLAIPLMFKQPMVGTGLGSFESGFSLYQPPELPARWNRMHWDWLQTAIEAGWPVLLMLLALTFLWLRTWKKNLDVLARKSERSSVPEMWILRLLPWAGCATVLLCSIADFPLREPGLAFVFFFLAGHLGVPVYAATPSPNTASAKFSFFKSRWIAAPLLIALSLSAFISARNGLACARSPWLGQLYFPPEVGSDPFAWDAATATDPGDPTLHYFASQAANRAAHAEPKVYQAGLKHARIAAALSPNDYLIPWSAGSLAEKLGNLDEADAFNRRAIALYPGSIQLHRDRGLMFLRNWVLTENAGSLRREDGIQKAADELRWLIRAAPDEAENAKSWMLGAGCLPQEVCLLWEGPGIRERVSRAKFLAEQDIWDAAGLQLIGVDSSLLLAGSWESIWYHGLNGILALERRDDSAGIAHWNAALEPEPFTSASLAFNNQERIRAAGYLVRALEGLSAERIEAISVGLGAKLVDYPDLTYALASRLLRFGRSVAADQLLQQAAGVSAGLHQFWALVSLQLNDDSGAQEHAIKAFQYSAAGSDIAKWYSEFMFDLDLRRRKRKGQSR